MTSEEIKKDIEEIVKLTEKLNEAEPDITNCEIKPLTRYALQDLKQYFEKLKTLGFDAEISAYIDACLKGAHTMIEKFEKDCAN